VAISPMVSLASSMHAGPLTYALLLGSGISVSSGVPSGWAVTLSLIKRLARLHGEDVGTDPIEWYRGRVGGDPDYSEVLTELAPTPADRRNLLSQYFEPTDDEREQGLKLPTEAHHAIAKLVADGLVRVVVTTNFDRLLEVALSDAGVPASVVSSPGHAAGAMPIAHSRCTIIKVHGDYLSPELKNTVDELAGYDPSIDRLLDEVFDQYGLVVCGWSGRWDTALRHAILRSPNRRFATYWFHRGSLAPEAEEMLQHRDAISVPIQDADTAMSELRAKVKALSEVPDQRPLDTAVAVAQLKMYLPDPVHRIRLHELVIGEADAAIEQVNGLSMSEHLGFHEYAERMDVYEQAMFGLLKLLVTGAFFSDDEEHDRLWVRCIERLATRGLVSAGSGPSINMQQYPTLLALFALGIGSVAANRIDPIARALGEITMRKDRRPPRTVAVAVSTSEVLASQAVNRALYGTERRMTPVSDHLLDVIRPAIHDIVREADRQQELFDEVEYLMGIAFAAHFGDGTSPPTRAVWLYHMADSYAGTSVRHHGHVLVDAGVFEGPEHLTQTCDAYEEYQRRLYSSLRYGS